MSTQKQTGRYTLRIIRDAEASQPYEVVKDTLRPVKPTEREGKIEG